MQGGSELYRGKGEQDGIVIKQTHLLSSTLYKSKQNSFNECKCLQLTVITSKAIAKLTSSDKTPAVSGRLNV